MDREIVLLGRLNRLTVSKRNGELSGRMEFEFDAEIAGLIDIHAPGDLVAIGIPLNIEGAEVRFRVPSVEASDGPTTQLSG